MILMYLVTGKQNATPTTEGQKTMTQSRPNYKAQLVALDRVAEQLRLDYTVSKREAREAVQRFAEVLNVDITDLVHIVDIRDEVNA